MAPAPCGQDADAAAGYFGKIDVPGAVARDPLTIRYICHCGWYLIFNASLEGIASCDDLHVLGIRMEPADHMLVC